MVVVTEDAGYSAKDLKRPGIQQALEALRTKRADVLVVSKLDRLSRSMVDFSGLMERVSKQHWALIALDVDVDTTTAAGGFQASIMASVAAFERKRIGERTREGMAEKRAEGFVFGRPAGVPSEVVDRIRQEYRAGAILGAIADSLTAGGVQPAQGGSRWWASTVGGVLHRAGCSPGAVGHVRQGSPVCMTSYRSCHGSRYRG